MWILGGHNKCRKVDLLSRSQKKSTFPVAPSSRRTSRNVGVWYFPFLCNGSREILLKNYYDAVMELADLEDNESNCGMQLT